MMNGKARVPAAENLAFALGMGFLALVLAVFGMLADMRRTTSEKEEIVALSKRPIVSTVAARGSIGMRVHRLGGKGEALFGAILPLRFSEGALMAAALFRPDGELKTIRAAGESRALDKKEIAALLQGFVGWDGRNPGSGVGRPTGKAGQAWETRERGIVVALALENAAHAVRSAAKVNP